MRQAGLPLLVKRAFDRSLAAVALAMTAPVIAGTAASIWFSMGSPVLFRQRRPGYKAKPFELLKFRTMTDARGPDGELLPDPMRLTRMGRFLRSTSLDELPQLINILRGDMSFVGPRPLLMKYLERYSPEQARRHDVLPGLTGWSQVNGRNAPSWPDKLAFDGWYVDNWRLRLDAKILLLTVLRVLQRQGISREGFDTTPEFQGEQPPA